jgi:hypothetical protein
MNKLFERRLVFFFLCSLPLLPLLASQVPCGRLIVVSSSPLFSLGGAAGLRGTFPGHPRPPPPLLSPFWTTQYAHNTTSMGGPSDRDLNPADLAVVVGRVSLFLPPPYRQPLKDIYTHPWPGGGSFLGKNSPPSVRFELTSAGTAISEHCLRQPCGHRVTLVNNSKLWVDA